MKKILITLFVLIALSIYYSYQYTSMYLWFNSNESLIIKIKEGKSEDINFLGALKAIENNNNHKYDLFLLEILKQKEKLGGTICKQCYLTATSYANEILNKKYPGNNVTYLTNLNIMSEIREEKIYINEEVKQQLKIFIDDFDKNKEKIYEIINKNNEESIKKWEKIINKN